MPRFSPSVVLFLLLAELCSSVQVRGETSYKLIFDAATGRFCPLVTEKGDLAPDHLQVADTVTVEIARADWETNYEVKFALGELATSRPTAFGVVDTLAQLPKLGQLFTESRGAGVGDPVSIEMSPSQKIRKAVTEIREANSDLDAVQRWLDQSAAALCPVTCDVEAANKAVNAFFADAPCSYQGHKDSIEHIRKAASQIAHGIDQLNIYFSEAAAQPHLDKLANVKRVIAESGEAIRELRDGQGDAAEKSKTAKINKEILKEFAAWDGRDTTDPFLSCCPEDQLPPIAELRLRYAAINASVLANLALAKESGLKVAAAEGRLRAAVAEFNSRYARNQAKWRGADQPWTCSVAPIKIPAIDTCAETEARSIYVSIPPVQDQKTLDISVLGKVAPLTLSVAVAETKTATVGNINQPNVPQPTSSQPATSVPTTTAAATDQVLLAKVTYEVHKLHHVRLAAGFIYSQVDEVDFALTTRSITETKPDGTTSSVKKQEIYQSKGSEYQIEPVFNIMIYPKAKDLNQQSYRTRGGKVWIPGILVGFSLADPTKHYMLGVNFEPRAGLDLNLGWHWSKQPRLFDGYEVGQLLGESDTLPKSESFEDGFFLGVSVDTRLFLDMFKALFSGT